MVAHSSQGILQDAFQHLLIHVDLFGCPKRTTQQAQEVQEHQLVGALILLQELDALQEQILVLPQPVDEEAQEDQGLREVATCLRLEVCLHQVPKGCHALFTMQYGQ